MECHFGSEDIRYKPDYQAKLKARKEAKESAKAKKEFKPQTKETSKANTQEIKMAVEDTAPVSISSQVPDVLSALNDPLCGSGDASSSPGSPEHLYSSSPVKSDSAQSKSSCEWSDLIEQDEKELRVRNKSTSHFT